MTAYNAGISLMYDGKLRQAISQLERAIGARPSYGASYYALGEIYGKQHMQSQGCFAGAEFRDLADRREKVFELLTFEVSAAGKGITISMHPDSDKQG